MSFQKLTYLNCLAVLESSKVETSTFESRIEYFKSAFRTHILPPDVKNGWKVSPSDHISIFNSLSILLSALLDLNVGDVRSPLFLPGLESLR